MADLILNRYKPISQAGAGGFGTVIMAWDTRMRRKVAIKCIPLKTDLTSETGTTQIIDQNPDVDKTQVIKKNSPNNLKSVDEAGEHWQDNIPGLEEARTAAMIQDANIVTVYDFELSGNTAYIIMEYIEGLTLTQFLQQYSDVMTLDMLTCIFCGIAHALEVAHSKNVLHLDIKPDNVLIDSKGKVKVTDFGLATLADEFGFGTANAGTIGYMPPEQMRKQALDVRTDLWSLACITYEMLCGKNPFDANTIPESLRKIEESKLLCPSACWEDFNEDFDRIVFKALSPNPDNRFDSVLEFNEEMSKCLSNARAGQRQIVSLFRDDDTIEEAIESKKNNESKLLDNVTSSKGVSIFGRIFSSLSSLLVVYFSCLNISIFNPSGSYYLNILGFVSVAIVAGLGVVFPSVGFGFAILFLCTSLILSGNIICAGILALLIVFWSIYNFKKPISNVNTLASYPIFSAFGFAHFSSLLTGVFCDVKDSLINSFLGFFICAILAAMGTKNIIGWEPLNYMLFSTGSFSNSFIQDSLFNLCTKLFFWVWGASWILCSLICSICNLSRLKFIKIFGIIAGMVVLIVGICFGNFLANAMSYWQPQGWQILPVITAGILCMIITIFRPNIQKK